MRSLAKLAVSVTAIALSAAGSARADEPPRAAEAAAPAPARATEPAQGAASPAPSSPAAPRSVPPAPPSAPIPAPKAAPPPEASPLAAALRSPDSVRPPPLHVEYAQYGVAIAAEVNVGTGAVCPEQHAAQGISPPCILGSGGGLALRGGYRSPGPWYIGGAYEFVKMDSGNLYRLGIFQQIRAEMRYLPDTGYRASPYVTWGLGAMAYGNEWGIETGGALVFGGAGVEVEVSRTAVLGLGFVYRPVIVAGWTDTAGVARDTGLAQFLGIELVLEVRSELGRR